MQSDREKWDRIYAKRGPDGPQEAEFIEDYLPLLHTGDTLDLASGEGNIALSLARRGLTCTLLDISPLALQRAKVFAQAEDLQIQCICADLDQQPEDIPLSKASFKNIIIHRFKPAAHHWPAIINWLSPGGCLLIVSFNLTHHRRTGFNRNYCLEADELRDLHPELVLDQFQSVHRGEGDFDEYLFKKLPKLNLP